MADKQSNKRSILFGLIAAGLLAAGGASAFWFGYQLMQPAQATLTLPSVNQTINLATTQTGLHAINVGRLGIQSWSAQPVAITDQGQPIPVLIDEDKLIFFAHEQTSKYSAKRIYQLHLGDNALDSELAFERFDGDPAQAAVSHETVQRIVTFEENLRYVSTARQDDSDQPTWFWERIHVSGLFEFEADFPSVADGSARVTAKLFGVSHDSQIENDHDLDLVINDRKLTQIVWDGNQHAEITVDLPAGSLSNRSNLIQLDNRPEGAAFVDISELDSLVFSYSSYPILQEQQLHFSTAAGRVELSGFSGDPYVIAFDQNNIGRIADNITPQRGRVAINFPQESVVYASGSSELLEPEILDILPPGQTLQAAPQQTDLLIITDKELAGSLDPFVQAREGEGLAVKVATVENIYNQFGFGQPSPFAIQAYLKDAAVNWPKPAPAYLLLVGGTTYDYKNHLNTDRQNRVPSMLIKVSHSGETVSDARLADIDGDDRADFAVGRWPVNSPEELQAIINRTLAYEAEMPGNEILVTADSSETDFSITSDRLLDTTGLARLSPTKAYSATPDSVTEAWGAGNWLVTYVGHGSLDLWGAQGLISGDMVENLQNPLGIAQPIVLQFTCLTGYFAHPIESSLSEKMLLQENGPVLIVSATSLTYSISQEPFARGLLEGLQDPKLNRIGDVMAQAQAGLDISNPTVKEVYDTFVLFGDPSATISRPTAAVSK